MVGSVKHILIPVNRAATALWDGKVITARRALSETTLATRVIRLGVTPLGLIPCATRLAFTEPVLLLISTSPIAIAKLDMLDSPAKCRKLIVIFIII